MSDLLFLGNAGTGVATTRIGVKTPKKSDYEAVVSKAQLSVQKLVDKKIV
jgi:hypothetical protein